MITPSDLQGGVDLNSLRPGSVIDVETQTRHYHIECLGENDTRISGHPEYCPEPVRAHVKSPIEAGRGLTFLVNDNRPVTTTMVLNFRVRQPAGASLNSATRIN